MSRTSRFLPTLLVLALPAAAAIAPPPNLPATLAAPQALEPAFMLSGSGVQVYQCSLLAANTWGWAYVAPDATLYEGARAVGTHKSPDVWESTSDRSSVTAVPRASQPAGAGNLPWQALRAAPLNPTGIFANVAFMQRVNTSGGVPAATGCGPDNVGEEARVAFRADYYFYKPAGAG